MANRKNTQLILFLSMVAVVVIGYFDGFAPVTYFWKATGKLIMFVGIPLVYWKMRPDFSYKRLFRLEKKPLTLAIALGATVIVVILGTYFLLLPYLDFSAVTGELDSRMSINESNFVLVACYIALCNSFLEEFFFRGFLFFRLKEESNLLFAHLASATIFSLYHVAIMVTWFDWWVFALCMISLVIGGVIFNLLDNGTESLYPSWLTHGCANVAINTIGMILFFG